MNARGYNRAELFEGIRMEMIRIHILFAGVITPTASGHVTTTPY